MTIGVQLTDCTPMVSGSVGGERQDTESYENPTVIAVSRDAFRLSCHAGVERMVRVTVDS